MAQISAHALDTGGITITDRHYSYGPQNSSMNRAWQWLMTMVAEQYYSQLFVRPRQNQETGEIESVFVVGEPTNIQAVVRPVRLAQEPPERRSYPAVADLQGPDGLLR